MVKDYSDIERKPAAANSLLFPISSKVFLYMHHPTDGLYYTSRRALAGTRNSSMGPPHEGSIRRPIAPRANVLTMELHFAPKMKDDKPKPPPPSPQKKKKNPKNPKKPVYKHITKVEGRYCSVGNTGTIQ